MSFRFKKLTIGKGKTTGNKAQNEWARRYYEVEVVIDDENDIEIAKASVEGLIDGWLNGKSGFLEGEFPEKPYDKLMWTDGQGRRGSYQMVSAKNNGNGNLYRHLVAILKQNNGRFSENKWKHYYWLGSECDAIFRRLKKRFR